MADPGNATPAAFTPRRPGDEIPESYSARSLNSFLTSARSIFGRVSNPKISQRRTITPEVWYARALANLKVEDPDLLRGMPVASGLRSFAAVLSDRPATAEYFDLSAPIGEDACIGTFISHNWSTPRWEKFLVLIFHFNLNAAFVLALIVAACVCGLTAGGLLPTLVGTAYRGTDAVDYPQGALCMPLGLAAFFAALLWLHELGRCIPSHWQHSVFLDKTCVHQCSADLKRKGIQCLAAFLWRSSDILVLYSDIYMQRLFTMYEIASWLMLHQGEKVIVRPVSAPITFLFLCLCFVALEVVFLVKRLTDFEAFVPLLPEPLVFVVCMVPTFVASTWLGGKWMADCQKVEKHAANFTLAAAKCACEADRGVLLQNILAFMKYAKMCDVEAEDAEILQMFEELVHREVPLLMRSSLGRVAVPYNWVLVLGLPHLLATLDYLAGALLTEIPTREIILYLTLNIFVACIGGALFVAFVMVILRHRSMQSLLGCIGVGLLTNGLLSGAFMLLEAMTREAQHSDMWLAWLGVVYAIGTVITIILYGRLPRACCWS